MVLLTVPILIMKESPDAIGPSRVIVMDFVPEFIVIVGDNTGV